MKCKCCLREKQETRLDVCFDCANAESILVDGVDMYDGEVKKVDGMSTALSKIHHILKSYLYGKNHQKS